MIRLRPFIIVVMSLSIAPVCAWAQAQPQASPPPQTQPQAQAQAASPPGSAPRVFTLEEALQYAAEQYIRQSKRRSSR